MAEIMLKRRGGALWPVDEEGRKFVRGLESVARLKLSRPRETRRDILNRYSHAIYNEAARMIGSTPEDEKAFCKYTYGVPILCNDPDDGEECSDYYGRLLYGVPYEQRIARMHDGHRFYIPVTSLFNDFQMTRYIQRCLRHYAEDHCVAILTPRERQWINDPQFARSAT